MTIRRRVATAVAGLLAIAMLGVGCSAHSVDSPSTSPEKSSAERLAALADCQDAPRTGDGQSLHCRVQAAALTKLTFEYTDPGVAPTTGDGRRVATVVVRLGGTVVQRISQELGPASPQPPDVVDLDHDRLVELIFTTDRASGGTRVVVWHEKSPEGTFVQAGEIFGSVPYVEVTPEGFLASLGRDGAGSGEYQIFRLVGDSIQTLLTLPVRMYHPDTPVQPDDRYRYVVNGKTQCALITPPAAEAQALREVAIDPATAATRFCHQGWVKSAYE